MITTKPVFYYDYPINAEQQFLNINEGAGDISIELIPNNYSAQGLANEVSRALSEQGGQDYTCTFNRTTRSFTISAALSFDLLIQTGANVGLGAFSVLGFVGSDQTGLTSYTGDPAGQEFIPQFPLQDYVDFSDFKEFREAKVNESASGEVEIYSLGTNSFMEFNLTLATNIDQGFNSIVRTDSLGVEKLRDFINYCITKGDVEFMKDETDRLNFQTIILESTPLSRTGTGYKLNELYSRGLAGYFETGTLKWRLKS
jgi:hypothetical protein